MKRGGIYGDPGYTAKSIYDLFRLFLDAIPYVSESEKKEYGELINRCEEVNMFGTTAQLIKTEDQNV